MEGKASWVEVMVGRLGGRLEMEPAPLCWGEMCLEARQGTHFGRVVVMQKSRVLPQNKAPHLPVFPLVPLRQKKGVWLMGDSL